MSFGIKDLHMGNVFDGQICSKLIIESIGRRLWEPLVDQ